MPKKWTFEEPQNFEAITLRQIMFDDAPILHVSHNSDDGAWQFLGWETPRVEDGIVVCLEEIVDSDPSVAELADLPLGWHAWRRTVNDPWVREPSPYDSAEENEN